MTNQKECKEIRMESWQLKLLSRGIQIKTKSKDQATKNHKK